MEPRTTQMTDSGSDLDARFAALERRLERVERRVGITPRAVPNVETATGETAPAPATPQSNLLLGGRSLIALGGAYLLRALAESKIVPVAAGVALGLAYAAVWLWRSYTHAQHGRRAHAAFCAAIAAVILYPIIWEATTRFALFNSAAAAVAIAITTMALVVIGYRNGGERIAWIGSAGAIGTTVAIAAGTSHLAAPLLALAAAGATTWWCAVRRHWRYAPIPIAIEFNLVAAALVVMSLLDRAAEPRNVAAVALLAGFAIFAGAIVTRPLVRREDVGPVDATQVALSSLPTLIGAPLLAAPIPSLQTVIALLIGATGALSYLAMVRTRSMKVAPFFFGAVGVHAVIVATATMLTAPIAAALWGAAAGLTALVARRGNAPLFGHAAVYALASSIAAGLFAGALGVLSGLGRHPLNLSIANLIATAGIATAAVVAITSYDQPWRIARLILAAIATLLTLGALAAAIVPISNNDAGAAAALRSAVIALAAVTLTFAARARWASELAVLVTPLLILGGAKFLFDDFGSGRAVSLFITLATYGVALVLIARFRTPATRDA